jgi:hypothetical protein
MHITSVLAHDAIAADLKLNRRQAVRRSPGLICPPDRIAPSAAPRADTIITVTLDVQRCRSELDELETELDRWAAAGEPGFDLWRHKMHALIGEILDPNHSLAIRLVGLTDQLRGGAPRRGGAADDAILLFNSLIGR